MCWVTTDLRSSFRHLFSLGSFTRYVQVFSRRARFHSFGRAGRGVAADHRSFLLAAQPCRAESRVPRGLPHRSASHAHLEAPEVDLVTARPSLLPRPLQLTYHTSPAVGHDPALAMCAKKPGGRRYTRGRRNACSSHAHTPCHARPHTGHPLARATRAQHGKEEKAITSRAVTQTAPEIERDGAAVYQASGAAGGFF